MEPFIGEIRLLPYTFSPRNWALCNGQLLPVSQHSALFSILGTTYGGDGRTTFALPDLRGRTVPGAGQGPGLQPWNNGTQRGEAAVALTSGEMPPHSHRIGGLDTPGDTDVPSAEVYLGQDRRGGSGVISFLANSETNPNVTMHPQALTDSGDGQPHENRQPFLSLNYCIALQGIFPSRQ